MLTTLLIGVGAVYVTASLLLFCFGLNLTVFSLMSLRSTRTNTRRLAESSPPESALASVTVQLPIYNEMFVAQRVIAAAAGLDYPQHLLKIQVLDDSTDATSDLIADAVEQQRARGIDIIHIRRMDRGGFKAGALAAGLELCTTDLVAIFDADFVPAPDFLRQTVPHFAGDDVAFVQARWGHLNERHSPLTRMQAMAIDGHFGVEQVARGQAGLWFNFNGTCGLWRTVAITDAGGWTADTLTEDLDLSYRAHLRGWRGVYLDDVVVPGEIPAQMSGFRRQQHRWARGSLECAIKLLPRIWSSDQPRRIKLQASAHLLAYTIHALLLILTVLYPFVALLGARVEGARTLFGLSYGLAIASAAPALFLMAGQIRLGRHPIRSLPRVAALVVLGSGLMANSVRAFIDIRLRPHADFERTAKFGLEDKAGTWTHGQYQQKLDRIVFAELALGVYALGAAVLATRLESWGIAAYSTLFGVSLISVAVATVTQHIVLLRHLRLIEPASSSNSVQLLDDHVEAQPTRFGRS